MILPMITSLFLIIAIVCILNLTPQQISNDITLILSKKPNLRDRARALRAGKKKKGLGAKLEYLQSALSACGVYEHLDISSRNHLAVKCALLAVVAVIEEELFGNLFQ